MRRDEAGEARFDAAVSQSAVPSHPLKYGKREPTASFQKFNLENWAQPLGDLNLQMACWSESTMVLGFETLGTYEIV